MLLSASALLLQLLAPAPSQAQNEARTLRLARIEQQRFESLRRMRLPVEWNGASNSGRCDARIGRFCYWYDSTESRPVPEPRSIAEARAKLLAVLDSAAARSPADGWIAGQRVRYLMEAGRFDDAVAAARGCAAERWWCAALGGLALHVAQRFAAADSAFAVALAEMPSERRCEWQDVSILVPTAIARRLKHLDCDERARMGQRVLTVAQPLWGTGVNDFATELLARHTMALILARSANAMGMSWSGDSRELLLRYGWPEWFTRHEPVGPYATAVITGHDREPSYALMPAADWRDRWPRLTSESWRLHDPFAPSRYAPRAVERLGVLSHQLARFPRGDSTLLVAAMAPLDTAIAHDSTTAHLVALVRDSFVRASSSRTFVTLAVPSETLIASVELAGARSRHAARARYTVDPLPRVGNATLSDLLLFDPARVEGEGLDGVLPAALTGARVSARDPLGLYWELHSSGRLTPARVSVTVEPRPGITRRIATALHLVAARAPVRLRWDAMVELDKPQRFTIQLPGRASGTYRIVLTIQRPGSDPLTASREIEVVP